MKARWAGYFRDLWNRPPPQRRLHRIGRIGVLLDLSENPPTRREVERTIQKLKNNEAPGLDGIVAELRKLATTEVISSLHRLLLKIWDDEVVPEDWCKGPFAAITVVSPSCLFLAKYLGISSWTGCEKVLRKSSVRTKEVSGVDVVGQTRSSAFGC